MEERERGNEWKLEACVARLEKKNTARAPSRGRNGNRVKEQRWRKKKYIDAREAERASVKEAEARDGREVSEGDGKTKEKKYWK